MIFLRAVPPEVMQGVLTGAYKVTGSVVRDVATGQGVAFLQETGVLQSLMNTALQGLGSTVSGGFSPLALISVVQNQQIKARLTEVQASLGLLQNLLIGTLAVSGLGLGISVAGFAAVLARLKGIERHLTSIDAKIEKVTKDRRSDDLRMIFADVGTQLGTVDTLPARSNKVHAAEAAEQALATSAGRLEVHFQQHSETMQSGRLTTADLEMLWSLAAAIRICHEAGLRALFSIDELEAAGRLAERRATASLQLGQALSPDTLARLCAQGEADPLKYVGLRRSALPQAEALVKGMRDTVASIGSQAELARHLLANQIPGPVYLAETAGERETPLLLLPASNS